MNVHQPYDTRVVNNEQYTHIQGAPFTICQKLDDDKV